MNSEFRTALLSAARFDALDSPGCPPRRCTESPSTPPRSTPILEAMRPIAGPIYPLPRMVVSNVYLVDNGPGDRWLIDSGHWSERGTLLRGLRRTGLRPSELSGVLITHRHSDHAGNASFLQRDYGIKVFAHRRDADVLERRVARPIMRGRNGGSMTAWLFAQVENALPAAPVRIDRALENGDSIAGLEVHAMPGHTDGSVVYRHAPTLSLFSGDALLAARPPLTIIQGMTLPYPTYTTDMRQALGSLHSFHQKGIPYENLLAGHGRPIVGGARDAAKRLVDAALG